MMDPAIAPDRSVRVRRRVNTPGHPGVPFRIAPAWPGVRHAGFFLADRYKTGKKSENCPPPNHGQTVYLQKDRHVPTRPSFPFIAVP